MTENDVVRSKPPAHVKPKHIRWSSEETDKVVLKAYQLLDDGHAKSLTDAVIKAQDLVIDNHLRRRPTASLQSGVTKFKIRYKEIQALLKSAEHEVEPAKASEISASEQLAQEADVFHHDDDDDNQIDTIERSSSEFSNFDFVHSAIQKIAEGFKQALISELKIQVTNAFAEVGQSAYDQVLNFRSQPHIQEKKAPKVVVCGVRPGYSGRLKTDFGSLLKLSIIEERQSAIRLKHSSQGADFVIINTSYCGHDYLDQVKNHPGLIRITGGQEAFDEALSKIIKNS